MMMVNSSITCLGWRSETESQPGPRLRLGNQKGGFAIDKGARLAKPNGTVKYLYQCTEAKLRAVVLQTIIDATPYIADLQKRFYKEMLSARMDLILNHSLEMLSEMRHRQNGIAERQQEMKFL